MAVLLCKWQEQLVRAFLAAGTEVYLVLDDFDVAQQAAPASLLAAVAGSYQVADFDSLESLAAVAADLTLRGVRVDRIVSHAEFSQFGAGYLDILLRDGAARPLAHVAARDKRLMKSVARQAGIPTARSAALRSVDDGAGADAVSRDFTFPVVVKPAAGMGALSTIKVDRPDQLRTALHGLALEPGLHSRQLAVEEFVAGRELHIDALWSAGRPVYFVVSAYYENRLAITEQAAAGDLRDGSRVIRAAEQPALYRRIEALHERVNRAFGVTDTATHLELFVTADGGLVFSELATRIGGGYIPGLLTQVLGDEVWHVIARAAVAGPVSLGPADGGPRYLGGFFLKPAGPGVITGMPTGREALACPGVLRWERLREPGDRVGDNPNKRWSAMVIVGGDTRADFDAAVDRAHRDLIIRVTS